MNHTKKLAFDTAEKLLIATLEDANTIPNNEYGDYLAKEFKALYDGILPIVEDIMKD